MLNSWCKQAQATVKELELGELKGDLLDFDIAQKLFLADYMCNRHYKEKEWTERRREYPENTVTHSTVSLVEEKAKDVAHGYAHEHCDCEADTEMQRIIDTGNIEMMHKLSGILSEHFEDVAMISPKVYHKLVEKMKGVKY